MAGPSGPENKQPNINHASSGIQLPELRYLAIGRIVRAHGVRGELSVTVLTDFPERFASTEWVYLGDEFEANAYKLVKHRWHKQNVLLTFEGIATRTEAEKFIGQMVQIPIEEAMPLPEGSFYLFELVGLQVFTTTGDLLGVITDVLETGANDVLVVKTGDEKEVLLPNIPDVVKTVDLDAGRMTIELIAGLI